MKNKFRRPELLAPAGNLETAVAAFNAGADAVYLGLGKFNARHRAENFSLDALSRLLEFAHKQHKKVYLTLNTLVCESELPEFMSQLSEVAQLPLDAVIVQDLGVLFMIRRYFPDLTVHASTQMGIHNSSGIKLLKQLGVKRVILERQLTAGEIALIAANSPIELEVFAHGSLCLSLSGRCLISHYAEEASGNRGMCRQLCRRNYKTSPSEPGRVCLSPRDLQMINELPQLSGMGIASLKIEGRLRGPDYVVPVVQAYRQAIDALPSASPEALKMLNRTISRGAGNGTWNNFAHILNQDNQAVFGRRVGMIRNSGTHGLEVQLTDRIHLGDKLRIVNSENISVDGFDLTNIVVNGQSLSAASRNAVVVIPGRFKHFTGKNFLYKVGENGYDYKRQAAALPPACTRIKLGIVLDANGLHISSPDLPEFEFHSENFAPAERCAITREELIEVFSGGNDLWRGQVDSVQINGRWFCAKSVLKNIRRELFTVLVPLWEKHKNPARTASRAMMLFYRDYQSPRTDGPRSEPPPGDVFVIPGFIAETDLETYKQQIRHAFEQGIRKFHIGGLHALLMLKQVIPNLHNIYITAQYPLPVTNSMAVRLLQSLSVDAATPWLELPETERILLASHSPLPMPDAPADCELLVTRIPIKTPHLQDKDGNKYTVKLDKKEKLYKLYGPTPAGEKFRTDNNF